MANVHTTLTSLFDDIADAIRENTPVTEQIKADAFPAYIRMLGYDGTIPATPSVLDSCPWDFIRWASDEGIADLLWSVGDRKGVPISQWGNTNSGFQVNGGAFYCYILGFNHNSDIEGENRIHFEFGFSALSGGVHIAFASSGDYELLYPQDTSTDYYVRMNPTRKTSGGWEQSTMRTGTLNGSYHSFKSACPSDLISEMKTVIKYTDNVAGGAGSVKENVTATTDSFFVVNAVEVFGSSQYTNTYEMEYTKQYQYYKNGNAKFRYHSNEQTKPVKTVTRSARTNNTELFTGISTTEGSIARIYGEVCYAVSPCFCI